MPGPRVSSSRVGWERPVVVAGRVAVREARVALVVVVHPTREHRALIRREPAFGFGHPEPTPLVVGVVVVVVVVGVAARLQHAKPRRQLLVEPRRDRLLRRNVVVYIVLVTHLSRSSFVPVVDRSVLRSVPIARKLHVREPPALREGPRARRVPPLPRLRVYPVHRKKPPRVIRHGVNRPRDVLDLVCARKVRQRHAREPRTQHLRLVQQVRLYVRGGGFVDAQQDVRVRSSAGASPASLDAEDVVEHRAHERVVEEPRRGPGAVAGVERGGADEEGDYGQPPDFPGIAARAAAAPTLSVPLLPSVRPRTQQHDPRVRRQRLEQRVPEPRLRPRDQPRAHRRLHLERQPRPRRSHDVLRPSFLALHPVAQVPVIGARHEEHRPAPRFARHVVLEQRALRHEHPGRPRSPGELVRRHEDGVFVHVCVERARVRVEDDGVHVHVHVRRRGGVVPERQRAVRVQRLRDGVHVGEDAGDVRRRAERADEGRVVRVPSQGGCEGAHARPAGAGILRDRDDDGAGFAPREEVAVVLVRADEDDRSGASRGPAGQRNVRAERSRESIDRAGAAAPGEDDHVAVLVAVAHPRVDALRHHLPRLLPEAAALRARGRRRRVRVGVEGQDVATDLALDAAQGPAGGGPVGVDHELLAVRAGERGAVADDVAAHARQRRFILRGHLHGRHGGRAQSRRRLL